MPVRPRPGMFRSTKAVLLAGSLLMGGVPVLAQEGVDPASVPEDGERREGAVTVYATSNPIAVFDYPGQVSVVTRETLDTLAPSAISDALRDVAGLNFAGGPRRTGEVPSLRGFTGQNVLILLDGARQSFISQHDGRFFLDPDLIGAAEAVKGPASALYGSGAVGGVLAFESVDAADLLRAGESWGGRTRIGYQGVNGETLLSQTLFTRQGQFDGLASFGVRRSGDIRLGSGADLPSDDDIRTGLVKASYRVSNALVVEGSWQRFGNTAIEPNNGTGTFGTGDSVLDREVEKDIETDTVRFGMDYEPAGNDWVDLSFTAYRTLTTVDEFDKTIPRSTLREIETTGLSVRNASEFSIGTARTVLTVGGDWYEDQQIGRDDQSADGVRGGVPNGKSTFSGVFVQLVTELDSPFGEFLIIPGVRHDHFESSSSIAPGVTNSDDAISPRIAVSYGPQNWLRLFASYSEGFRAPSINELYLDGVHFSVPHPVLFNPRAGQFVFVNNNFVANPDIRPEHADTLEFGAGVDFAALFVPGDRLQAKVSYYESEVTDLINLAIDFNYDPTCFAAPRFFPCSAGISYSANIDNATIDGVEAELRYSADTLTVSANFATVNGKNLANGTDIGALTPDRFALNVSYAVPRWSARFGASLQLAADFDRLETNQTEGSTVSESRDGYAVLDLFASWQPAFAKGLRFDVGVDNVFDKDYERVFEGVSEPGRNLKIAATWQFGG
jgi:hemoglobin/transferrin/lactoferrin receptor protein